MVLNKTYRIELAQVYHRNAIAITLVARILPQLLCCRYENYGYFLNLN